MGLGTIVDKKDIYVGPYDKEWGNKIIGLLWLKSRDTLENGKNPLIPTSDFYGKWNNSRHDLALVAGKILCYLKYKPKSTLKVDFMKKLDCPGYITMKNNSSRIVVHSFYKNNPVTCSAILAHEICHLILNERGIREEDNFINEQLTDFCTIYYGLGILVLNGKSNIKKNSFGQLIKDMISIIAYVISLGSIKGYMFSGNKIFGYWNSNDYYEIFKGYLLTNKLDWSLISKYLLTFSYKGL